MKTGWIVGAGGVAAMTIALQQAYRRWRLRQLVLMPKGINTAHGITMRSSIKAARPVSVAPPK